MDKVQLPASAPTPEAKQSVRLPATVEHVLDARWPSDAQISPDGQRVAFCVSERVPGQQHPRQRIWLADLHGGEPHPLINGKSDESAPRWSPDGTSLAFITRPEGQKEQPQLHLIASSGGKPGLLCKMPNGVSNPAWAPDGSRITFLSIEGQEPQTDPYILNPARPRRLWALRQDQAIPEPVTSLGQTIREYCWAPDSQQIALYYSQGSEDDDWYHSQIGIVARNGGAIQELTHLTMPARALAWAPDGKQLAYLSGHWSDPGRGCGDIFLLTLENKQIRNLTPALACSPSWLAWLPDNRHLLFTAVKDVTGQINLLDTVTGTMTVVEQDFVMQRDQPRLSLTPNQQLCATIHSTSQQPPDVWTGRFTSIDNKPAGLEWLQLSRLNPLIEETVELAKAERISYTSSDGWLIHGLFIPPSKPPAAGLPPLYVEVHGGPSATTCDNWLPPTHLLTGHGYAVFHPNMRGSWGQGALFADAVLGDMGGKDLQDILHGIDYLVHAGKVDGSRVAIGGWSNGGFLSAWAVTQTDRFRAAMVGAGITDWHNMHAQSDIPSSDMMLLAADPLEQPEVYRQCSPITYAKNVKTPTLILHGEEDPVVPVAQAYAFYRALQERQVPSACVIYPREGHGLGEQDHLRDFLTRLLNWLDRYLS